MTSALTRELNEQLQHVQTAITIFDRSNMKIIATIEKYYSEKPESAYVLVRLFTRKSEIEKFQQVVFVNCKLDEFMYLLDVNNE